MKKPFYIILLLIIFSFCKQKKVELISTFMSEKEIAIKFNNLDQSQIHKAKSIGLLNFKDSLCAKKINVKAPINLNFPLNNFKIAKLERFVESLYQIFGDPTIAQVENLYYEDLGIDFLLGLIKTGEVAPQCEGISRIAKVILENDKTEELRVEVLRISTVIHTLNAIYFKKDKKTYAIIFDIQNGFFFPSKSTDSLSFYSLSEIDSLNQFNNDFLFYWLEDSVLLKKRNLLNDILPCNFLADLGVNYHHPQKGSPYKYELLGPSFHKILWFDKEKVNKQQLEREFIDLLLSNN